MRRRERLQPVAVSYTHLDVYKRQGLQRLGFGGDTVGEGASSDAEAALRLIKADPQPNLYVMCDLHPFFDDNPKLVRLLKEVAMAEAIHKPTLVLVSHAMKLPAEVPVSYTHLIPGTRTR